MEKQLRLFSIDGSASGVQFVARQLTRTFLNFDACPGTPNNSNTTASAIVPAGSKQYSCNILGGAVTSTIESVVPSVGTSDVEPARFEGDNAPAAASPVTGADTAVLTVVPGRAVIFGIFGNEKMWKHLQARQGLIGPSAPAIMPVLYGDDPSTTSTAIVHYPNPAFSESLRPSITKAEYRAIVKGDITDVKDIVGKYGVPPAAGTTNTNALFTGALELARRVNGSGTQAMSNILFLNNPCGGPLGANYVPVDSSAGAQTLNSGNYTVTLGSGTGNVLDRLALSNIPTIGVVSQENPELGIVAARGAYGAFKLDGVSPDRASVINGSYDFFAEETVQWNNTVIASGSNAELFLTRFTNAAGSVATLQQLPAATQAGSAALSAYNGQPSTNTNWIMNSSREGNNCKPAARIIE
jgi:hypothetical protein